MCPLPAITGFSLQSTAIFDGSQTTLTATLSGGVGMVVDSNGGSPVVVPGTPLTVSPSTSTQYTLVVTSPAGHRAISGPIVLQVAPASFSSGALTASPGAMTVGVPTTITFTAPTLASGVTASVSGPGLASPVPIASAGTVSRSITASGAGVSTYTLTMTDVGLSQTANTTVQAVVLPSISGALTVTLPTVLLASSSQFLFQIPPVSGASSLVITGGGLSLPVTGSTAAATAPRATTRYTLTASNLAGSTVTRTVVVLAADVLGGPGVPTVRFGAATAMLPDGRVLIVGGSTTADGANPVNTAALYDPATGTVSTAPGTMSVSRYRPTATLITGGVQTGRVLIAGGAFGESQVDLFDPPSGFFITDAHVAQTRCGGAAAVEVKPGTVAIIGGTDCAPSPTPRSTVEWWDATLGTSGTETLGTNLMPHAHAGTTATLLSNGKILIVGGASQIGDVMTVNATPRNSIFGSVTLQSARQGQPATTLANGKVLLAGGTSTSPRAEIYDAISNSTQPTTGDMIAARTNAAAVTLPSGLVLVIGGTVSGAATNSTEYFDPVNGTFATGPSLRAPRSMLFAVAVANATTFVGGGYADSATPPTSELLVTP